VPADRSPTSANASLYGRLNGACARPVAARRAHREETARRWCWRSRSIPTTAICVRTYRAETSAIEVGRGRAGRTTAGSIHSPPSSAPHATERSSPSPCKSPELPSGVLEDYGRRFASIRRPPARRGLKIAVIRRRPPPSAVITPPGAHGFDNRPAAKGTGLGGVRRSTAVRTLASWSWRDALKAPILPGRSGRRDGRRRRQAAPNVPDPRHARAAHPPAGKADVEHLHERSAHRPSPRNM